MAQVLKVFHLAQQDGMAQVNVGRGRIESGFDDKRFAGFDVPPHFFIIDIEHLIPSRHNALPLKGPVGRRRPVSGGNGKNIPLAGFVSCLFIKPRQVFLDEFRYREVVGTA